jgi:hypothetical protein
VGIIGPRVIGRIGGKRAVVAGFLLQAAATLALVLLGPPADHDRRVMVGTTGGSWSARPVSREADVHRGR